MIGLLGLILPFALLLGNYFATGEPMERSISAYYHTDMGYLFVGIMIATGAFLICYNSGNHYKRGESKDKLKQLPLLPSKWQPEGLPTPGDKFTTLSGWLAILVAVFPTTYKHVPVPVFVGYVHLVAAATFLFTTAYMSKRFAEQDDDSNNSLHTMCARIIVVTVVLLVVGKLAGWEPFRNWVWWLETVAVSAFGLSWMVASGLLDRRGIRTTLLGVVGLSAAILISPMY